MNAFKGWIIRALWATASLLFTCILLLIFLYVYVELQLPNVDALRDVRLQVPLTVLSADGQLIEQYGNARRIPTPLEEIPKTLINAVLATEDSRFYEHAGVDLVGLLRSAKAVFLSGKKIQGASTIPMQVARNFFLTRQKTYTRKMNEILLALKIDKAFSKDKILELYLNKIYFGHRAYGVAAAAEVYYGKKLNQLTLPQMAMIAGLPQAPSRNNPIDRPKAALERRAHVLKRMEEGGFISPEQYEIAVNAPLTATYHEPKRGLQAPYLAEMVREVMVSEYGEAAYEKGLTVYTTVSSSLQIAANASLWKGLEAYDKRHGYRRPSLHFKTTASEKWVPLLKQLPLTHHLFPAAVKSVSEDKIIVLVSTGALVQWDRSSEVSSEGFLKTVFRAPRQWLQRGDVVWVTATQRGWVLEQFPQVQGALVAMNPHDGAILALVGGSDYERSRFNRAIQAQRQTGSNFKPFIYSAALEKGYTLATLINDAPVVIEDPSAQDNVWRPVNDSHEFYGPTPFRVGLVKSRNLVSIRILQSIGLTYALDYLQRFGFSARDLPHGLSLALGSASVSPLQVARGYSIFANGGFQITPYFIQKVLDQEGTVLFEASPSVACDLCVQDPTQAANVSEPLAPWVIPPQNAYLMSKVLQDVIEEGTARSALSLRRNDLAGKTGTTNQQIDAWFSGYNKALEATVWVGFDNQQSLSEYGAQVALPIWIQFMAKALKGSPECALPQPPGLVMVRIDPNTGLRAHASNPRAKFEIFRINEVPTQFSTDPSEGSEESKPDVSSNGDTVDTNLSQ